MASATQTRPQQQHYPPPQPEYLPPEDQMEEDRELEDSQALVRLNKGELEMQMEFARKFPRSMDRVLKTLKDRTCYNQAIALEMSYSLPRGGKQITGASSRFAEILAASWGNNMSMCRVVGADDEWVRAQGIYFDCESNYRHGREVARRITDKDNRRFNQDMIGVTGNAAASIAFRNAVLNGIGKGVWYPTYLESQRVAVGTAESVVKERDAILTWAKQAGVTGDMLFSTLQVQGVQDIIGEKFLALKIMQKEIMSGEKSLDEVFGALETANIEAAMGQLGWNEGQKTSSRVAFRGRPAEHLAYLREELTRREKAGVTTMPSQAPAKQQSTEDLVAQKSTPAFNEKQTATQEATPAQQEAPAQQQTVPDTTRPFPPQRATTQKNPKAMKW
jgi:hypothetical protein